MTGLVVAAVVGRGVVETGLVVAAVAGRGVVETAGDRVVVAAHAEMIVVGQGVQDNDSKGTSMPDDTSSITTTMLAETENVSIWQVAEPDGEMTYHLELNQITLHFFQEEWDEFMELIQSYRDN